MPVRAKFQCSSVTRHADGGTQVMMHPVYSGSEENRAFNDATPSGELRIHIAKGKPAAELFTPGAAYFLDFTPAPQA